MNGSALLFLFLATYSIVCVVCILATNSYVDTWHYNSQFIYVISVFI